MLCVCAQSLEARIRECEDQVGPVLARQRVLVGLRSFVTLRVAVSTTHRSMWFVFDCSPSQACYPGVDAAPAPNHRVQHHQQRVLTRIHGLHTDVDWQCGGCTQSALCVGGAADRGLTKCCWWCFPASIRAVGDGAVVRSASTTSDLDSGEVYEPSMLRARLAPCA